MIAVSKRNSGDRPDIVIESSFEKQGILVKMTAV
jgi:hypothetical protein